LAPDGDLLVVYGDDWLALTSQMVYTLYFIANAANVAGGVLKSLPGRFE
jgi:hypothetical protein